ncbi:MAG: 16S rRNA (guanine(527)-N(7))-methyltransferase RsmG [Gammaproteobacteria bacterium]|nr:16S rRNA (guanine(527)-N(7))-methyltransferase RsmG [Gammaproteobacteria bacterium]MYD75031.1 16S rRNA (guanine(527)-N(7))-methyltransferase RsmG [Gammaproteobacteria bacterium]MYJ52840.1 16S rRNA (guanine(527)-N(7))-methyltransferase RsmG [Gammaproteobacteria bacterium]
MPTGPMPPTKRTTGAPERRLLAQGCERLKLRLSEGQLDALWLHAQHLSRWGRRINLTSVLDPEQMIVRHVLDSLSVSPYLRGARLLDIGSGGGFPGLPLAIAHPDMQTVLLDSRRKKAEFLGHVAARIDLPNVAVARERIEKYRPDRKFDTHVARAVGPVQRLVEQTAPLCSAGSRLLIMKGRSPEAEVDALRHDGIRNATVVELRVPFLDAERNLVVIEF